MSIFNKLHSMLNSLEEGLKKRTDLEEESTEARETPRKERAKTAVENAEKAAEYITDYLRKAGYTGSTNPDLRRLEVLVCDDKLGNPQAWAGPEFMKILKDNLQANLMGFFTPEYKRLKAGESKTGLIEIAPDTIYIRLGAAGGSHAPGGRLALRLITGTGSSNREVHLLDAEVSREYFIGRGRPTDTDADKTRIFILEDEENSQLKERNGHVSHNQGQFFFDKKTNEWLIMRTPGTSSIKYTTGTDSIPSKCYPLSEADPKKLVPGMRLLFGSRDVTFIVEEAPDKEA